MILTYPQPKEQTTNNINIKRCDDWLIYYIPADIPLLGNKLPKGPTGLLGRSPPGLRRSLVCIRLINSENLRFSASGGPLSELVQSILLNNDALAGIAKPARASLSISIDTPMNAEARAGFAPKGPTGLLEASS